MQLVARKKPCCLNCGQGKPCCGGEPAAYRRAGGLWLPSRQILRPRAIARAGGGNWPDGWRPAFLPQRLLGLVVASHDLSCLPCCVTDCTDCDPGTLTLDYDISGAIISAGTLDRAGCGGVWSYLKLGAIPTDTCGGEFAAIDICVYCDGSGVPYATLGGGGGACGFAEFTAIAADGFSCNPFSATFTFHTQEALPGGCVCGDNAEIILVVNE